MTTALLVRHGRSTANTAGVLAGRTPDVHLDDVGRQQAATLAARLADLPLAAIVSSPLERTRETAEPMLAGRDPGLLRLDDRLGEAAYGEWTGRTLKELAKEPLWKAVQGHPSSVTFPGGESMLGMQERAVAAVRDWNARLGPDAVWVAVSHGDVIKSVVADALGMHLDSFQRIVIDPCSVTVVTYTDLRPFVARLNDTGAGFAAYLPRPKRRGRARKGAPDAAVGGGAGPS